MRGIIVSPRTSAAALTLVLLLAAYACNPMGPSPLIACPAAQSVQSPTGNAITVNYPMATITGGTAPVTTTCTPSSGSSFALGSTTVTCNAEDSDRRAASCTFAVSVTRPPQLTATRFLAFGDSITAGVIGSQCPVGGGVNCAITTWTMTSAERRLHLQRLFEHVEVSTAAYPRALQSLLAARYTSQSIEIANEGQGGEFVAEGKIRLAGLLSQPGLQVLLLQEGANDMNQVRPPIDAIVADLRTMVQAGRSRGMSVFVGTLLPQRQNACRGYDFCDGVNDTILTNARIRAIATSEGAFLVDLYQEFEGQTNTLLALDGLHPNEAGYQRMAQMFYDAIRQRLEGM